MKKKSKGVGRALLVLLGIALYVFSAWVLVAPYIKIETKELASREKAKDFVQTSSWARDVYTQYVEDVEWYKGFLISEAHDLVTGKTSITDNEQSRANGIEVEIKRKLPYGDLYLAMAKYNQEIFMNGQKYLDSVEAYSNECLDVRSYGLESDIVGSIYFPGLDVSFPLYLGGSMAHLNNGVAQLSQTSMPIGGINTNCVVAGHRGWSNGKYLKDIELIQVGDVLEVTTLWEIMHYRVTEIKVIMPRDVESILIQPGRDMLTIVTCHPYGTGGRYRYLLLCDRVEEEFLAESALYGSGTQHIIEQQTKSTEPQPQETEVETSAPSETRHTIHTDSAPNGTEIVNGITISSGVDFESSKQAIFLDDFLHYVGFALLAILPIVVIIILLVKKRKKGAKGNGQETTAEPEKG